MTRIAPWHSIKEDKYHNNDECTEGNNIETKYWKKGKGKSTNKLCKNCKRLNKQGK